MSVETTVEREQDTPLAELDPDQLTDADELYHMAQAMRDDDLFELPIVDWEKKNDAVLVTVITPNGETATVQETWPEKPTTDNNFIRACMCALDVDDAQSAALMADELQDVTHSDFTCPADKSDYHGWELEPEAESRDSLRSSVSAPEEASTLSWYWKVAAFVFGPITLVGEMFDALNNGDWDMETMAGENYWFIQAFIYGTLGTLVWIIAILLL